MNVYKFCQLDLWAIKNLYYSQLYFSGIESLNDAGECLFNIENDLLECNKEKFLKEARKIRVSYDLEVPENFYRYLNSSEKNRNGCGEVAAYIVAGILKKYKTCSFTNNEGVLNPIMWGHYGNKNKGICLGYKIDYDNSDEIEYISDEEIEKIYVSEVNVSNVKNIAKRIFYKKNEDWSYEKEYRFIGTDSLLNLPRECLKQVFFGSDVNINDAIFLIDMIKERHSGVDFFIAFHPRVENKMVLSVINGMSNKRISDKFEEIRNEDIFGSRYLLESALRKKLDIR